MTKRSSPMMTSGRRLLEGSGLSSTHEAIDVVRVARLLDVHYHVSGRLERLQTEKDDTFLCSTDTADYLVKVSPPDEEEVVVALQTAVMRFLEESAAHLPVQRVSLTVDGGDQVVIDAGDGSTRVMRVLDFVEGPVWAETTADSAQLAKVGEMLGSVDVALEDFAHPADQRDMVWDVQHFEKMRGLVQLVRNEPQRAVANEVFRLFGRAVGPRLNELETQVIHGDYSPYNVVVDPLSKDFVTGVIDFGDTVRSALIFDPAVSLANLLGRTPGHPWRDACAFAAGYQRARRIREPELVLLPVAALARLTLRALITNWRAERVPSRRDYLIAHALNDWTNLERAMAVPLSDVISDLAG